ncbi:hypothetical protein FISHEDRAFT_77398 [Fistulina hepatica ATCC 64428]|uniref:Uncharacterized protein n=1 Tax=Fistulina hepatica ATCC 64428 TaxID=1128425 RepID=A0A0D7A2J7_9AGAR|nr:hypothetical protein FISHEDRAFT_77398 [Fistulina hepatica ATCC 64428]
METAPAEFRVPYHRPAPHKDNACEANGLILHAEYGNQHRIAHNRHFYTYDKHFTRALFLPAMCEQTQLTVHPLLDLFTHTDGIVASIIDDDLITSPNSPRIPFPPFGHRVVRLREDLLYGPDDHLHWPQPNIDIYPHYACIMAPDPSDTSTQSYLYKPPADIGLQPAQTLARDLFTLTSEALQIFNDLGKRVRRKLKELIDDARSCERQLPASAQGYNATVVHTLARLQGIGFERTTLMLLVREVQRVLLETDAFVRYWSVYRPSFTAPWPDGGRPQPADARLLGAFVRDSDVAFQFASAGIPVYVIRPLHEVPLDTTHVLEWVTPDVPAISLQLQDCTPKFPPVWNGTAEHRGKYINMHRFTVTHLIFHDPWGKVVPVYNDSEFDPILRSSPAMGILPRPASSSTVMFSRLPKGPMPKRAARLPGYSLPNRLELHAIRLVVIYWLDPPSPYKRPSAPSTLGYDPPKLGKLKKKLGLSSPPGPAKSLLGAQLQTRLLLLRELLRHHPGLRLLLLRHLHLRCRLQCPNPSDMGPSERRARELLGSIFGKRDLNHLPPFVDFNGSQLSTDHLPEHEVYWDLAWEVNEANARLDLVRFLMHGVDDGNILARTDLVEGAIFLQLQTNTTTSFWTLSAMDFVELDGLCLKDLQERLLWVLSLGRAVSQCPAGSAIPEGLSFLASLEDEQIRHFGCNLAQAHSLEEVIITHYSLTESPGLKGRDRKIKIVKKTWTTKLMDNFPHATLDQAKKALDNAIKQARDRLTEHTEAASSADTQKIRHRTLGIGMLDHTGKTRYATANRPAIEERRHALLKSNPDKYGQNGGGAHQAALTELWSALSQEEKREYERLAAEEHDVDENIKQFPVELQVALEPYTKRNVLGDGGGEMMVFYAFHKKKNELKTGVIMSHCPSNLLTT